MIFMKFGTVNGTIIQATRVLDFYLALLIGGKGFLRMT